MHQRIEYTKGSFVKKLVNSLIITILIISAFTVIFVENVKAPEIYDPWQAGEAPTNGTTNITASPTLYVLVGDNDTGDTANITWWSNSSGPWVIFGTNNSIANNTNISQINSNFTDEGTKYWWSVNVTDGYNNWSNETYHLTINYAPTQSGESPTDDEDTVPTVAPTGEIPVLWVVLIVILSILFILWFFFKIGYLYFEDDAKTEKLDKKIRSPKKKK